MRAVISPTEKKITNSTLARLISIGQGVYPPVDEVLGMIKTKVDHVIALHGNDLAEEAGNPLSLNLVMLGALIGTGVLPVTEATLKDTISESTKKAFLESNLRAFDLGIEAGMKWRH